MTNDLVMENNTYSIFVKKLKDNPQFMSYVLYKFMKTERMKENDLISRLGTEEENFTRLAMCKHPRDEQFSNDIRIISEYCEIKTHLIANIIRQVEAIDLFTEIETQTNALEGVNRLNAGFAAARDCTDTDLNDSTEELPEDDDE